MSAFSVHATQNSLWKKQLDGEAEVFADGRKRASHDHESRDVELDQQIGKLQMKLDWLKKSCRPRLR